MCAMTPNYKNETVGPAATGFDLESGGKASPMNRGLASSQRPWRRCLDLYPWMVLLCAGLFLTGCPSKTPTTSAPEEAKPATDAKPATGPTQAQPKLPAIKLLLGAHEIMAELARTDTQWQTGMMFRKEIGDQEGMLFVFPFPHRASFYMKNTQVPLSCAYIDPEGVILELHDLKPFDEQPVGASSERVQYVLETAQGWFSKNQVSTGTVIRTESGSLAETFFTRR